MFFFKIVFYDLVVILSEVICFNKYRIEGVRIVLWLEERVNLWLNYVKNRCNRYNSLL